MFQRRTVTPALLALLLTVLFAAPAAAQSGVRPRPTPTPDEDEAERVYTEEVRIPVFAYDEKGRSDNRLEVDDVLVIEDGVPQRVRSVRRVPASVLLLLGAGYDVNLSMRAGVTRDLALGVLRGLREGDTVAAIQFNGKAEVLHGWTQDQSEVARALRAKLASGKGSNLSRAIRLAVQLLQEQPVGNRHLVLVTDGVDTGGANEYQEAVKRLIAAQTTLHVVSYAEVARADLKRQQKPKEAIGMAQSRADMATVGIDPTRPPGMRGSGVNPPSVNSGIRIDPELRRRRKEYEREVRRGEDRLKSLAEETGGRVLAPATFEELIAQGSGVAAEIEAQYVVTYQPKRPLRRAPAAEYRRIHIGSRRLGLNLRARRGYVVGTMQQAAPAAPAAPSMSKATE
jgi:VWFA-related protein